MAQKKDQVATTQNTAVEVKRETVDAVTERIKKLESRGEIQFPPHYSPQNALRSAWLILQETKDMNKHPVLEVCSRPSIMNSLLDMVIQGLNPAKKQCYFIAYGKSLSCMRSYHGTMALAKRVDPDIADIFAEVIWHGDEFEFEIDRGQKKILKHKQTIQSIDSKKAVGAYCQIIDHDGNIKRTEVMTWDQIKSAWKKSKTHPVTDKGTIKQGSTHDEFMSEMIKRTVINRACRPIINSSSDEYLRLSANRAEYEEANHSMETRESEEANSEFIDIGEAETPEPAPEEEKTDTSDLFPDAPENQVQEPPEWLNE